MIDYEFVFRRFKEYVGNFDLKNSKLALKERHSYHVADLANKLAKRMDLNEEDTILAKTIGLLHDIGRFVQYTKAHSYSDEKTKIDHALVADKYLFLEGHINDFKIPKKYHSIIREALLNHNKLQIDENLKEKELFFAKFLRDIDKIDIFRVEGSSFEFDYDAPLTIDVKDMFYKHTLIDRLKMKNKSDEIASSLAFVYDINFKESYELLNDTDNLELFLSVVDVKKGYEEDFENIKKEIRNYLEEKLSD